MFEWIFGRRRAAEEQTTDLLYDKIVAAARQTAPYAHWGVPDTPLGRYEMLALHLFLVLHRLRGQAGPAREMAQRLTDRFFADLDHSLRELGVGDLSVPKRMKKLGKMFYGRVASYGEALDRDDLDQLSAALARNIRPTDQDWPQVAHLGRYVQAAHRMLQDQDVEGLTAGMVRFPVAETV